MNNKTQVYGEFARYYDKLGWNKFSQICAERLKTFVRFRGTGKETVLDLACGTGELEYRLKNSRLEFTGVDISWKMLSSARRKNNNHKFVHADIATVRLNRKFDIVVCFFDSVNHLSGITAVRKLFRTARLHLRQDGFFIFDMLTPDGLAEWESLDIRRQKDYTVIMNGYYEPDKIIAEINIEGFVKAGDDTYNRFEQKIIERSYSLDKVTELLADSGFNNISVSSFNTDELIEKTSRWYFVVS